MPHSLPRSKVALDCNRYGSAEFVSLKPSLEGGARRPRGPNDSIGTSKPRPDLW
jgi:hypothetical protein